MNKVRHLLDSQDFNMEELERLFGLAEKIQQHPEKYLDVCKGNLLASLFYEPSTRTRFSFEAAMLRLGGEVIGFDDPNGSSVAKGESLGDTLKTVECYADVAVMRHPKEGAAKLASQYLSDMPLINAGDGGHQHPTQTLTDLMTIRSYKKRLDHMVVAVCGDLLFGRTIHSLVKALSRYPEIKFLFVSPKELRMPEYIKDSLSMDTYVEMESLEDALAEADVLYMSRVQKERFFSAEEYERLKDFYVLSKDKLQKAKKELIVMHPLPRVMEIAKDVDPDPRAVYFQQAKLGMYVRMALIMTLLEKEEIL
ncbi:aspartate carbamoyltransferase [Proteiniclasticum ruminis]|uniref:Aspartate carbamoyltransferase n=1 Tax=Proteiniclasticum ruminis TaxID=398199 RepID=A0A1G8H449_9CLOT|nr:aspartate carbamoyltransferase [Proteiniclasticum ruminis]SDI01383.1 aspartate carbamoyltransferase catalytic subunit [Proteiniclasticum ruminis]